MNGFKEYREHMMRYYENYNKSKNSNTNTNTNNKTISNENANTENNRHGANTNNNNNNNNNSNNASNSQNNSFCDSNLFQTHVHEFEASTNLAEQGTDRHNHRFAGVTSQVIPLPEGNHIHAIFTNTDFFGHLHEVGVETGPAIEVGEGKHVHFVRGVTTVDDGHFHNFAFATLIEAPLQSHHCR